MVLGGTVSYLEVIVFQMRLMVRARVLSHDEPSLFQSFLQYPIPIWLMFLFHVGKIVGTQKPIFTRGDPLPLQFPTLQCDIKLTKLFLFCVK